MTKTILICAGIVAVAAGATWGAVYLENKRQVAAAANTNINIHQQTMENVAAHTSQATSRMENLGVGQ